MANTIKEVDPLYEDLVRDVFEERNLHHFAELRVFAFEKVGNEVVKVQRANELAEKAWNADDVVVVTICEEIMDLVDDQTKRLWVENALAQVFFDTEKDKLIIGKEPAIKQVNLGMYYKYKDVLIQKLELQALTIQQYKDKEREKKKAEKEAKKAKKNQQ